MNIKNSIIIIILLFLSTYSYAAQNLKPVNLETINLKQAFGFAVLDLEKACGVKVTAKQRSRLESIVSDVVGQVKSKFDLKTPSFPREKAIALLTAIDKRLFEMGHSYPKPDKVKQLYSESLDKNNKAFLCRQNVYHYMTIGDELDIPLKPILIHRHIVIRWVLSDGSHINWEVTTAVAPDGSDTYRQAHIPDEDYINKFNIHKTPINNGCYFRQLSDLETLAFAMGTIGQTIARTNNFAKAIPFYDEVLRVFSLNPLIRNNRGFAHSYTGNFDKAIEDLKKAVELDPNKYWSHLDLALAYLQKNNNSEAEKHFKIANGLWPNQHAKMFLDKMGDAKFKEIFPQLLRDYYETMLRIPIPRHLEK